MTINDFINIEKKYRLYDASVNNINFWIYNRFDIWNYSICAANRGLKSYPMTRRSYQGQFRRFCNSIIHRKTPQDVDILFLPHERRIWNGETYQCIYTDELSMRFEKTATLERAFHGEHFTPAMSKNLIYDDMIQTKVKLKSKLFTRFRAGLCREIELQVKKVLEPVFHELNDSFNCNLSVENLAARMTRTVIEIPYYRTEYERLLNILNPKLIIEVVSYHRTNMIMNEIAKDRGIPVIELQHGTIYEDHLAYQYAFPTTIKQFPEQIYLFSDFWKGRMHSPIPDKCLISVGYPYFETKMKELKKIQREDKRYTILLISQQTIGEYLYLLAMNLFKLLPQDQYRIIFKLHPGEFENWESRFPAFKQTAIEVCAGNNKTIYEYFAVSDMQIGVYSTAIYEGLGFGLKTLILKVGHYDAMESLVANGYAQYIENAEDVFAQIQDADQTAVSHRLEGEFWKSDALNNMVRQIQHDFPDISLA